jgi:branched-chain amino acid transport system permease protein
MEQSLDIRTRSAAVAGGKWGRIALIGLLLAVLCIVPWFLNGYLVYMMNLILVYVIVTLGLNILMGEAGLFGLSHVAFYGIGIYTTALLTNNWQVPAILGMFVGGALAAAIGWCIGRISVRLKDIYLALSTFAFGEAMHWVFMNWDEVTGGPNGLRIRVSNIFGYEISSDHRAYVVVLLVTIGFVLLTLAISGSRLGRSMRAVRDSEPAAAAVGINVNSIKATAFALSSFYAAMAGGLYSTFFTFIHPDGLNFNFTIIVVTMLVVGGIGTIPGAILGAVLIGVVAELLRQALSFQEVFYGIVLMSFAVLAPKGIYGFYLQHFGGSRR